MLEIPSSNIALRGNYSARLLDRYGNILEERNGHNLIVNLGLDLVLSQLAGTTTTPAVYFALGSSTTAVTATQTALVSENVSSGCVRLQAGTTGQTITLNPLGGHGTLQFTMTWSATQNPNTTIGEVGVFTASSAGIMFSRFLITPTVPKDATTSFQLVYDIVGVAS
jgi:hypothetical protein